MYSTFEFNDGTIHFYKKNLIESYSIFAKQLLELAAENAEITDFTYELLQEYANKAINKQSILDTIKQIE